MNGHLFFECNEAFTLEVATLLIEEGFRVMTYEGKMGDEREFDLDATMERLKIFLELLSEKKKQG